MGAGYRSYTKSELEQLRKEREKQQQAELELANKKEQDRIKRQNNFAHDLTIEIFKIITENVIRPGPRPEERQCFDVANELTVFESEISSLIVKRLEEKRRRVKPQY